MGEGTLSLTLGFKGEFCKWRTKMTTKSKVPPCNRAPQPLGSRLNECPKSLRPAISTVQASPLSTCMSLGPTWVTAKTQSMAIGNSFLPNKKWQTHPEMKPVFLGRRKGRSRLGGGRKYLFREKSGYLLP